MHESLAQHLVQNATFFAERLTAMDPSAESSKLLLAQCYIRSNHSYRCYHLLKGCEGAACRYTFARAALEVGKLAEAERALMLSNNNMNSRMNETFGSQPNDLKGVVNKNGFGQTASKGHPSIPTGAGSGGSTIHRLRDPSALAPVSGKEEVVIAGGAAGRYLMGEIHIRTGRKATAIEHYCAALNIDPLMWCAYQALCEIGADEEVVEFISSVNGTVEEGGGITPSSAMFIGGAAPGSGVQRNVDGEKEFNLRDENCPALTPSTNIKPIHGQSSMTPAMTPASTGDFSTPSPSSFMTRSCILAMYVVDHSCLMLESSRPPLCG